MNNEFRYILEPYKGLNSRIICPSCKEKNQLASYIDIETNEKLSPTVGRCNREINCGYHYTPKQYFEDNNILQTKQFTNLRPLNITQEIKETTLSEIPFEILNKTRKAYNQNNFVEFLFDKIGEETATKVISLYHIGTSKHWTGATVFWQIDTQGKIRAGKVMLYDKETGQRVKKPYPHITWIHKLIEIKDYTLNQCLFGEHLLKAYPVKPIAIVESEKTATLAAAYRPEFNWLATGNLNNLSRERCKPLKDRNVLLFPDGGAYDKWKKKAEELKDIATFIVSDLIERYATPQQIEKGFDLADYFEGNPTVMFTRRKEFEQIPEIKLSKENNTPSEVLQLRDTFETDIVPSNNNFEVVNSNFIIKEVQKPKQWPVKELEDFFSSIVITDGPLTINNSFSIANLQKFIETHLPIVKANNGKEIFAGHYERLVTLKEYLSKCS